MAQPRPLGVIPLGDSAAYVEFSSTLDLEVNSVVQRLALAILKRKVAWIRDVVPALGGLALHFDLDHAELPAKPLEESLALVLENMKGAFRQGGAGPRDRAAGLLRDRVRARPGGSREEGRAFAAGGHASPRCPASTAC